MGSFFDAHPSFPALSGFGSTSDVTRVAAKSLAGGAASEIQGGRFEDGLYYSGVTSGARYAYNSIVGYDVTAAPGENRSKTDYTPVPNENGTLRLAPQDQTRNVVLYNEDYETGSRYPKWLRQGSPLSIAMNAAPGINAIAGADDFLNNNSTYGETRWFKVVTIPAALIVTVPALLDRVPAYRPMGH